MAVEDVVDDEVRAFRSNLRKTATEGAAPKSKKQVEQRADRIVAEALVGLRAGGGRVLRETEESLVGAGLDPRIAVQARGNIDTLIRRFEANARTLARETVRDILDRDKPVALALEALAAKIGNLADVTLAGFDRAVVLETAIRDDPETLFLYDGPLDSRTRTDCALWVGHVFTIEQIRGLTSIAGPQPVSVYCGGWNCRHRWVPVTREMVEALGLKRWRG